LVGQSEADDDATVVSQIQMDIHRTLTDNIFFRKGPGVRKLNEVLLAYSRRNKDVGYCQGMNLITANLLLIMPSAEDAFWILTSIIENILPHGYYDHSLRASRADQQVLRQYVTSILPKLSTHLNTLCIELEALTFQWFLSVFTDCLSAEALFRVWDVVLCTNDGSTFLFQVALALLKLNEGNLLLCDTPASVYTYINHQMTEHAISIDGLMQASEGLRRVVKREDVEMRREKAMRDERELVAARDGGSMKSRAEREELSTVDPRPLED
jgi:small G protein signaling modulator 3